MGERVAVIGSGYVGSVVAACLAHVGHAVVGVESDLRVSLALKRLHREKGRAQQQAAPVNDVLVARIQQHGHAGQQLR